MANSKISSLTAATTPLDGTEVLPIVQSSTTKKVANNDLRPKQIQSNATSGVMQIVGPAAAATRVMTIPDANFTVARTDAGQTFNGDQTIFSGSGVPFTVSSPSGSRCIEALTDGTYTARIGAYPPEASIYVGAQSNHPVSVIVNGTARFTFDTSSNLVPTTALKGINFTANTGAAGKTSQLLNWYEEGTWTPTDDSGASLAFTNVYGYYTRTGDIVTAFGRVTFPVTASALTIVIGGLPFTVANNNQPGGGFIRLTGSGRNDTVLASATTKQILFYANNLTAAINSNYSNSRVDWVVIYKV